MSAVDDAIGGPTSAGAGGSSPLTWSHTCSGSERALYVAVIVGAGTDGSYAISGVTYNGVALTFLGRRHSNDATFGYVELWRLVNPASGTNTVSVSFTGTLAGSDVIIGGSVSFNNVDQTTPDENFTSAAGESTAPSVNVTSRTGDRVLDAVCTGTGVTSSGQTLKWSLNQNSSSAAGNGAQSTAAGGASIAMSYVVGSDYWAIVGVSVRGSASGSPTVNPTGLALSASLGSQVTEIKQLPSGFALATTLGTPTPTTQSGATVTPSGLLISSSLGIFTVESDDTVLPAGGSLTLTLGTPTTSGVGGSINFSPAGFALSLSQGAPTKFVLPAGFSVPLQFGSPTIQISSIPQPSSLLGSLTLGAPSILGAVSAGPKARVGTGWFRRRRRR